MEDNLMITECSNPKIDAHIAHICSSHPGNTLVGVAILNYFLEHAAQQIDPSTT